MYLTLYAADGFSLENQGFVSALVTSLDQEANADSGESAEMYAWICWSRLIAFAVNATFILTTGIGA